jgi:hypothetical protein
LTPIEKIRAEVAELLRNHAADETRPHFSRAAHASPCAIYELAKDKLRLAEVLREIMDYFNRAGEVASETMADEMYCIAERGLEDVAT